MDRRQARTDRQGLCDPVLSSITNTVSPQQVGGEAEERKRIEKENWPSRFAIVSWLRSSNACPLLRKLTWLTVAIPDQHRPMPSSDLAKRHKAEAKRTLRRRRNF